MEGEKSEELAEFEKPRRPLDSWTAGLYKKHELGETPSLEDIEPVAKQLLESPLTTIEGAELVLGRSVDAQELRGTILGRVLMPGGLTADQKFGVLLLELKIEELKKEQEGQPQ